MSALPHLACIVPDSLTDDKILGIMTVFTKRKAPALLLSPRRGQDVTDDLASKILPKQAVRDKLGGLSRA